MHLTVYVMSMLTRLLKQKKNKEIRLADQLDANHHTCFE